jgi:hypothetical protein
MVGSRKKSNSPLYQKRLATILKTGKLGSYRKTSASKVPRVPRMKKDEDPRHHSDLFVDEEKSKSIKGLRFINEEEAKKSVEKIKKLYKAGKITFAHAKQAAMAMEQRSRFHAYPTVNIKKANKVWKKFLQTFKK